MVYETTKIIGAYRNESVLPTACEEVWEYSISSSTILDTQNVTMTRKGVLEYSRHVHSTYIINGVRERESNAFSYRVADFSITS